MLRCRIRRRRKESGIWSDGKGGQGLGIFGRCIYYIYFGIQSHLPKVYDMSLSMLELSSRLKCGKFLAAGTVAEYSLHAGTINNETLQKPNDMYGAAKTSARHFLEVRARQLGQPLIWMVLPRVCLKTHSYYTI